MKVLMVTGSYPPMTCGVGDYTRYLALSLAELPQMRVGVLTSESVGQQKCHEKIEIFPIIKNWSLAEVLKVVRIIKSWRPDIVHVQYPTQGYGGGLLPWFIPMISFFMAKKMVQTWHEGFSRRMILRLFLVSLIPCKVVVVRPQYREKILSRFFHWALWKKELFFIPSASSIPRVSLKNEEKDLLKKKYLNTQKRLIVFFGFIYPHKGVELLFDIADPASDQIVIAGKADEKSEYFSSIRRCASSHTWNGKVSFVGFLPPEEAARLLAVADAVILPFKDGGGEWNTSIHGAVSNGAFVITTSKSRQGYDSENNIYYANVNDVDEMRAVLSRYTGIRREYDVQVDANPWHKIAREHQMLYPSPGKPCS